MGGSSDSVASPNIVLNTIVAQSFKEACDYIEASDDMDIAVHDLIKKYANEHQRIIFNGNGYSKEWEEEAERRGLPNIKKMVDSIDALVSDKSIDLFESFGVFTKSELESRAEIQYSAYSKATNIEARTMIDVTGKQIIPAVIKFITQLANSVNAVKSVCDADVSVQTELIEETSALLSDTKVALQKLIDVTEQGSGLSDNCKQQAVFFKDEVAPAMEALRYPIDKLEMIVDKELWPMPSYGDLIFEV